MQVGYGSYSYIPYGTTSPNYTGLDTMNPSMIQYKNSDFPLINLHVSASSLKNVDVITVSDPFCILYVYDNNKWKEVGQTEIVWNNLNPQWVKFFTVMYVFEIKQPLLFRVFDADSNNKNDKSKRTLIGEAQIDVKSIVTEPKTTKLQLTSNNKENTGILYITPEQVEKGASQVRLQFSGSDIKKMRLFGSNHPFFVIAKASEGGYYLPIAQSDVCKKMKWDPVKVSFQALCSLDPERPLRITVFDERSFTSAVPIGYADTTFTYLSENIGSKLELKNEKKKSVGYLTIKDVSIKQIFTFYDFIHGGVQLNLITAIDFTASNRDPCDPRSLHHFSNSNTLNPYQSCIKAVGEILCPYDSDQLFPVLGFGAKINGQIQHCFPLTFNPNSPCVSGLDGILGAYQYALSQVHLSGPTLFAPIIRYSTHVAVESYQQSRTYTILLIITDGIINDMQDTIDAIVAAGPNPLSIIIVGVGNADFEAMNVLDADDEPLVSRNGAKECRDLVQFVPYRNFVKTHYSYLAAEVLDEIPRQLVEWASINNIRP